MMIADRPVEVHGHSSSPAHGAATITGVLWPTLLAGLAAVALLAPIPASLVERLYSSGLFPLLQRTLTSASNLTAVAWLDLLIVIVGAALALRTLRDVGRQPPSRAVARLAARLVSVAAIVCLAFVLLWGLNYRRTPLREKVPYQPSRITVDAAAALAGDTVKRVNTLHARGAR